MSTFLLFRVRRWCGFGRKGFIKCQAVDYIRGMRFKSVFVSVVVICVCGGEVKTRRGKEDSSPRSGSKTAHKETLLLLFDKENRAILRW